uniref:Uncharacterized protein n=1 Tax=viral metagenome TaxID=1070528 RepID=A0A6C0HMQ7_9ZZZZ
MAKQKNIDKQLQKPNTPKTKQKSPAKPHCTFPETKGLSKDANVEQFQQFFDTCQKQWRKNKVYMTSKHMWAYKTFGDSPLTHAECLCKTPKHPNETDWCQCEYVDPVGIKCANLCTFPNQVDQATLSKSEPTFDCEIYTNVRMCTNHKEYAATEQEYRIQKLKTFIP